MIYAGRRTLCFAFAFLAAADCGALAQEQNKTTDELDPAPVLERQVDQADRGSGKVKVFIDQAKIVKLPEKTATLVVGNPLVADVAVQPGGVVVVTGKGYGVTNMVAMDRAGIVLAERLIEVGSPRGSVVAVYRGIERESYSCTPECERRITLGDSPAYFNATLGQAGTLNVQALGGAAAPK